MRPGETLEPARQLWGRLTASGQSSITKLPCNIGGPATSLGKPYSVKGGRISTALHYETMAFSQSRRIHPKTESSDNSYVSRTTYYNMPEDQDTAVGELRISAGKNQYHLRLVAELQEGWISFVSELPERPTSDGWSRVLWTERTQLTEATARLRAREAFKNNKDMLDFLDRQSKQT
jgi:hypothetical protein